MSELTITQEELDKKITAAVETATKKLADKNETLMGELKNARQRVADFKDYSPDDVKKALEKAKEQQDAAAAALADRGEYEKALKKAQEQHAEEISKLKGQLEDSTKETRNMLVDAAMNKAMAKAGVAEPFRKAVAAMHKGDISIIEREGKKVAVVGDLDVAGFMKEWAGTDEGKNFVAASGDGGGGSIGGNKSNSGVINPWKSETRNLSQQGIMERDNPSQAAALKREAGVIEAA